MADTNQVDQRNAGTDKRVQLRLRVLPDPILRNKSTPVQRFDKKLRRLVKDMAVFMRANDGIGLAGPQIGLSNRLFTAEVEGEFLFLANPQVVDLGDKTEASVEGCLSLPGQAVRVARPEEITVSGYDYKGKRITLTLNGLWARVVLHEMDHLDGILIPDRGTPVPVEEADDE